jgi:uncharacterized membrane protein YfcA
VLAQAAGFALLAALSPTALLVTATYLGSARPRLTALCYLAGAVLMSTVIGIVVLVVLRSGHLSYRNHHTPRYGLRLGLGFLTLAVGAVMARRRPRLPDPSRPGGGIVSRLVSSPAPLTARSSPRTGSSGLSSVPDRWLAAACWPEVRARDHQPQLGISGENVRR